METKKVILENNDYFDVEQLIKKVAKDNAIKNITAVEVELTPTKGVVKFKEAAMDLTLEEAEEMDNDMVVQESAMDTYEQKIKKTVEDFRNGQFTNEECLHICLGALQTAALTAFGSEDITSYKPGENIPLKFKKKYIDFTDKNRDAIEFIGDLQTFFLDNIDTRIGDADPETYGYFEKESNPYFEFLKEIFIDKKEEFFI